MEEEIKREEVKRRKKGIKEGEKGARGEKERWMEEKKDGGERKCRWGGGGEKKPKREG